MTRRAASALAALLFAGFLVDALLVHTGITAAPDRALLAWDRVAGPAHAFRGAPWLLRLLVAVTMLGTVQVRVPLAVVGSLGLAYAGRGQASRTLALAVAGGMILLPIVKALVGRARPDAVWQLVAETRMSFPSGHAMGSMILYPLLGVAIGRAWRHPVALLLAGMAVALLIGVSRVLLGVHWASDVVGGWLLGGACAAAAIAVVRADAPPAP